MCEYKYGDIVISDLGINDGNLQSFKRPVVIISNDFCNRYSPVVSILPMTSKKKRNIPTHVPIKDCGLARPSLVLAEQITSINQSCLKKKIGSIKDTIYEKQIKKAIEIQLNLVDEAI